MSVLVNQAFMNPIRALWNTATESGKFAVTAGTTQTISINGMTASGLVMVNYLHVNQSGGATQFIKNVVPGSNSVTVTLGQTGTVGEFIVWQVLKYH